MSQARSYLLVAAVLCIAATAMIYQFCVISSLIYIIGDSLVLFSVFTGVFLFAMGIGSLVAGSWASGSRDFVRTQFWLACLGLAALPFIFLLFGGLYYLRRTGVAIPPGLMDLTLWAGGLFVDSLFGILTGMQLPMLQGIFRELRGEDKSLATLLGFDYIGSFVGAVAFPLFLFPTLGLFRTVFLAALVNTLVAFLSLRLLDHRNRRYTALAAGLAVLVILSFAGSHRLENLVDRLVYGSH